MCQTNVFDHRSSSKIENKACPIRNMTLAWCYDQVLVIFAIPQFLNFPFAQVSARFAQELMKTSLLGFSNVGHGKQ